MAAGSQFAELDRRAADNFGRAAARAGVRRIIYLGGLTDDIGASSAHLKSRAETGEALRASGVPVIEFRASIVIGAGSLSFEMIQALVERLPVMVCPRWVATLTQPIAIDDVLAYLEAALDLPEGRGRRVRNRRTGGRLLRRHDARVRAAARAASAAAAGAGADAAPVRPLARAGHARAGARRSRARRRIEECDGRPVAGGARDVSDSTRCHCATRS